MDGYSLDAQKDKLRKYAEYQDMTVVSEFSDEGFSGKNIKCRPEFTRMMEKLNRVRMKSRLFALYTTAISIQMLKLMV